MGGKGGNDAPQQQAPPSFQARPALNQDAERAAAMKAAQDQWQAPRFNKPEPPKQPQVQQPPTALPDTTAGLGDVLAASMNPAANYATPEQQAAAAAQQAGAVLPLTGGSV